MIAKIKITIKIRAGIRVKIPTRTNTAGINNISTIVKYILITENMAEIGDKNKYMIVPNKYVFTKNKFALLFFISKDNV